MNTAKIEAAITSNTVAIMPVHCYGKPCKTKEIDAIAKKHGLKVIYDAAHAFGVKVNGESILNAGDISTLSFHATKVYNTIEGGALICHSREMKEKIDHLKNFGFEDEVTVVAPGINSKMDEVRSAYGLLNLRQVDAAIEARHKVADVYRAALRDVKGICFFDDMLGVKHNYSYFPIFVEAEQYGMTRDELYEKMKSQNIYGRRYFYPLISTFEHYRDYPSANAANLPVATKVAEQVICLPMHHELKDDDVLRIINIICNK
jgi:dTDP-4-amino-4,6-dideoxygalactose transaminase